MLLCCVTSEDIPSETVDELADDGIEQFGMVMVQDEKHGQTGDKHHHHHHHAHHKHKPHHFGKKPVFKNIMSLMGRHLHAPSNNSRRSPTIPGYYIVSNTLVKCIQDMFINNF